MNRNVLQQAEQYTKKRKRYKLWQKIVTGLSSVVVFVTTYLLILPAITLESDVFCGIEEHLHDDSCYVQVVDSLEPVLICTEESQTVHIHTDECYVTESGHVHSDDCFNATRGAPICTLSEEEGHTHTDECFEVAFELICNLEEAEEVQTLICTIPEFQEHVHDESCYKAVEPELTCMLMEDENHSHTDRCYGTWEMACGKEEHTHVKACYSDPNADLETKDDWEATFADVERTGILAKDVLVIAESQLGYHESIRNYIVSEDGESIKGYTRYGEWYGDPYGDWCAMFVSFCLHYAGAEDFLLNDNCADWRTELMKEGLFAEPEAGEPAPGDLIFFDWQGDGSSDHIGFVVDYMPATGEGTAKVRTIEGNSGNQVEYVTYDASDSGIMGYGLLTQPPEVSGEPYSLIGESGMIMYHLPTRLEYQYSSHRVNNFVPMNYVLIPESILEGWIPNLLDWSAKAEANYVVAYSLDCETELKAERTSYVTCRIEESEYSKAAEDISGIIRYAYPYITVDEMRKELADAYARGEISMDLSCCSEADYIAAIQWAIWETSGKTAEDLDTVTLAEFPPDNADALNPLTNVGHADPTTIQSHVAAIHDWLMTRRVPQDLQVADYESEITRNAEGTYDMVATVTLDRPLEGLERIDGIFYADEKSFAFEISEEGVQTFDVTLKGLTAEEIMRAEAKLTVNVTQLQVYVYDSTESQDMVSGQWEEDSYELAFAIEPETTDVEVIKHWTDPEIGAESIQVQLYADGEKYGESVRLSDSNDWKYIWDNLLKYNSEGEEVDYVVAEELVPSYYSAVIKNNGVSQILTAFDSVDAFAEGETYIFTCTGSEGAVKALADVTGDAGSGLDWIGETDITDADSVPDNARWMASDVSDDGTNAYLKNKATGNYLSYDGNTYITLSESASEKAYFLYKHLYFLKGDASQHLISLDNGVGYTTDVWDDANILLMNLYKQTQVAETTAEISYLITNTRTTENTQISVKKEWAGREFGEYPGSVVVYLLQNGERYGDGITLNEENGWYYRWEELPLKIDDTLFTYTVEESIVNDYTVEILPSTEEDGTLIFTITNTWNPDYVLPETGGIGTQMYTLGGLLLMAAAMGLLLYRKHNNYGKDLRL